MNHMNYYRLLNLELGTSFQSLHMIYTTIHHLPFYIDKVQIEEVLKHIYLHFCFELTFFRYQVSRGLTTYHQ